MRTAFIWLLFSQVAFGAQAIRVVPVMETPQPETVELSIAFPQEYENKRKQPINVQLRLEGFPLGVTSEFDRRNEVYDNPKGQSIHLIIDNRPYEAYYQSANDPSEDRAFYDKFLNFNLPYKLDAGQHIIRAFPCRSYGESIKDPGAFAERVFYLYDKRRINDLDIDLSGPYLTYNEPQGSYPAGGPILLDFYLTNVELSADGYKVRLSVDGKNEQVLTQWVPYYLYGLSPGRHTVRLELLDPSGEVVPGLFNNTARDIIIGK